MIGPGMSTFTYDPGQLTSGWTCRPVAIYWLILDVMICMHASGYLQQQINTKVSLLFMS